MTNYYASSINLEGKQAKGLTFTLDLPPQFLQESKKVKVCTLPFNCIDSVKNYFD
jgi:hypothetical protein